MPKRIRRLLNMLLAPMLFECGGPGYDVALAKKIREIVNIPITILGGAGSLNDLESLIHACGVVGASAGSLFVFKGVYKAVLINYPTMVQRDEIIRRALI